MSTSSTKIKLASAYLILIFALFTNCNSIRFNSTLSTIDIKNQNGNGEYYSGKPGYFLYFDPRQPCSELNLNGSPFPNRQIFNHRGRLALVRDQCKDLEPVDIPSHQVQYDSLLDILRFQGQVFQLNSDLSAFDLAHPACPDGRTLLTRSSTNLYVDSLDLSSNNWKMHPEVGVYLFGSIMGLPRHRIEAVSIDTNLLKDWIRVAQYMNDAQPNVYYAASFFLQPGSLSTAVIYHYVDVGTGFSITLDLNALKGTVRDTMGMLPPNFSMVRYGSGVIVTVFFKSNSTFVDLGVAPWRGDPKSDVLKTGDFIYATSGQLRAIDSYCSP